MYRRQGEEGYLAQQNSEKTATPLARWWTGAGMGPGRGQRWGGVYAVGRQSLNPTVDELMHHSRENREAPPTFPPTFHAAGNPWRAE